MDGSRSSEAGRPRVDESNEEEAGMGDVPTTHTPTIKPGRGRSV